MNDRDLRLFELPVTGDTAVLTCGHRVSVPMNPRRRRDDWWASLHCARCDRNREVVQVIYPKEGTAA